MPKGKKKTHEEFVKEIYELFGEEYTVLGTYINNKTNILIKHNTCGHEYEVKPFSILAGHGCPKCNRTFTKSHEQFVKEVYDLVGDEYTVLGTYVKNNEKVLMLHNTCGHKWGVRPSGFLHNTRCPKCARINGAKKLSKSHEQFVKEVYDLVGDEYTVLSEYTNSNNKVILRHNTCGHEWKVPPNRFLHGSRCPLCCNGHIYVPEDTSIMTDLFIKKVHSLVGDEYTVLSEYKNSFDKIKIRHNTCGHEWEISPTNFLSGQRCPKCVRKAKSRKDTTLLTTEEFKKRVYNLVGDEYTVLGDYINSTTKILMRHNTCGHEYEVEPRMFMLYYNDIINGVKGKVGSRCPKCANKNKKNKYLDVILEECKYYCGEVELERKEENNA